MITMGTKIELHCYMPEDMSIIINGTHLKEKDVIVVDKTDFDVYTDHNKKLEYVGSFKDIPNNSKCYVVCYPWEHKDPNYNLYLTYDTDTACPRVNAVFYKRLRNIVRKRNG